MKTALYARVSKWDDSQDPESQLMHLRSYASQQGLEIYGEYVDYASGADSSRPELDRMIEDARARCFELLLAVKLDRIARSMPNFYALLEQLSLCDVRVQCVDQPEISTRTSTSRFMMAIIGAVAEYERELIRERTNAGLARAKAQGKTLGRPRVSVDSERVIELLEDGKSVREVAQELGVSVGTVSRRSKNAPSISPSEESPKSAVPKTSD